MLATYMRRMRNNNLEIRIAGSSFRHSYMFALRALITQVRIWKSFRVQN